MKFLYSILILLFTSVSMLAQSTGTVRGTVYNKASGEPVIFTKVQIEGTTTGRATDVNGVYQLGNLKPGTYTIIVANVEFQTMKVEVTIKADRITTQNIYLSAGKELDGFTLDAKSIRDRNSVGSSTIKATAKDIKRVPSTGGEPDLATYFQTVPGVVTTGDQGGQMYVRGGSPVQNKILLDGMVIYNPFHSIGFFSVFDTELIKNADIYTGGFGAEYGGRISSVMDVSTIDGNKKKMGGRVAVSPFGAKLTLEGPIKKLKENSDNQGTVSYIFSAKTSYLEQSSKLLYAYVDEDGLPFNYTDVFGKISVNGVTGSKVNIFGYNFRDNVKWQGISDLNWNSYGMGTNFMLLPSGSPVQISGKFGFSKYDISLSELDAVTGLEKAPRQSGINNFNLGFDFKVFKDQDVIKYGVEIGGFGTDYSFTNSANRLIEQNQSTTEIGGYLDYKIKRGLLIVNPGLRAQYYASLGDMSIEPRLGIKYIVNETLRLKASGGLYSQNLIAANSDRDVVNLFYGFLSGPDNLQDEIIKPNGDVVERKHSLQKSTHFIIGAEKDVNKNVSLNVEAYYKIFNQLTNTNRNKIYEDTPDNDDKPDILKKDFIIESGAAKGFDVVLTYSKKRLYLWFVYSLGKVDRWNGIDTTYSPIFDRRHNINFVSTYYLDKDKKWEIDFRWNFGSGLPFTQTQGYSHQIDFNQGINTNLGTNNSDELDIVYADLNGGRLPSYHRLDVSLKRTLDLKTSKMEFNLSITNAYNQNNIFYVDRITNERVNQLPILPSIGFNWKF
ncbi:MAG: hypothetical protein ACI8Q1_001227 [Parvicella sp.]|jgi:hypothetical protein